MAQRVLEGRTRGYRHHPQLARFRQAAEPLAAIGAYLGGVLGDAVRRGYSFDPSLIVKAGQHPSIAVTDGQLRFEVRHLRSKLLIRNPELVDGVAVHETEPHPLFRIVRGPCESWERQAGE